MRDLVWRQWLETGVSRWECSFQESISTLCCTVHSSHRQTSPTIRFTTSIWPFSHRKLKCHLELHLKSHTSRTSRDLSHLSSRVLSFEARHMVMGDGENEGKGRFKQKAEADLGFNFRLWITKNSSVFGTVGKERGTEQARGRQRGGDGQNLQETERESNICSVRPCFRISLSLALPLPPSLPALTPVSVF